MTTPASSGASPHALAPSGIYPVERNGMSSSSTANGAVVNPQSPANCGFLDSDQLRKIQSTAQQALAQCMELGLHVLPIHSAEQRDMLAAKLVESAYEGVGSACSCRDLGAALPSLTMLIQPSGRDLQHPLHLEQYAHKGSTESSQGTRDDGVQGSHGTDVAQHASPTVVSEALDSSRKRRADVSPEASGSPLKRQQIERSPAAQLAVSSAAPDGTVTTLMTDLEQEVRQDLAQWSETRNAGILDSISAKIEGANAALQSRAAAAEPVQSAAHAASEEQAQAAALAKIDAINSRLVLAGVAPHVVPAMAPSVSDALAAKIAVANATFMQAMPLPSAGAGSTASPSNTPVPGVSTASSAVTDAARLAALDAKLAQFQQAAPSSGGVALASARSDSIALLDAKLARYGAAPAGPSPLPANGLYQPSLHLNMGYSQGLAAGAFPIGGAGGLPGAGLLGAGMPNLTTGLVRAVPGNWQTGSLGGQAPSAQLSWQQALQAHPGVHAPMASIPRGPLHNGVGMHGLGTPQPTNFRNAPGAPSGSRPMSGLNVKARLQQEALARLQQINKGRRT